MKRIQAQLDRLIDEYDSQMLGGGRLRNIIESLCHVLDWDVPGDIVEFGTYQGQAAILMTQVADLMEKPRKVWVYDSFEGLPGKTQEDQGAKRFKAGSLKTSRTVLENNFAKAGVRSPTIVAGWFSTLAASHLPTQICFAHLDGDFYHSILDSLKLIWPKMSMGARIIIDDYGWKELPGVLAAGTHFFADKKERVQPLQTQEEEGYQGLVIRS